MPNGRDLDIDVLRTFVTGFDLGSFARAASVRGRSQPAISAQLRKLEADVGQPLVRKDGRHLAPTPAGEKLLAYARRILDLNDEALAAVREPEVEGTVRLGVPADFAESWLPDVLGRFVRAHPRARVEVRTERSGELAGAVGSHALDLALCWGEAGGVPHAEHLSDLPVHWIGKPGWDRTAPAPPEVPLAVFDAPCVFRSIGLKALDQAGLPWRVAFASPSVPSLWAAVGAGLGVTVRTTVAMPASLAVLDPKASGLPALPHVSLVLCRAQHALRGAAGALRDSIHLALADHLGRGMPGPRAAWSARGEDTMSRPDR